ncbi:hypothetical protein EDD86DRAFT_208741, partial [Gorgonomyces haynaldii]
MNFSLPKDIQNAPVQHSLANQTPNTLFSAISKMPLEVNPFEASFKQMPEIKTIKEEKESPPMLEQSTPLASPKPSVSPQSLLADEPKSPLTAPHIERRRSQSVFSGDDKRKTSLERNRQAALKCRRKKKEHLQYLEQQVDSLTAENQQLKDQILRHREEILSLKAMLMKKDAMPTLNSPVHNQQM